MASLIGKAKKLKRNGHFGDSEFKALKIEGAGAASEQSQGKPCSAAELVWANGQLIRFSDISNLIDFLKKICMISFNRRIHVYVAKGPTDMPASYDSLFLKVKETLKKDPFSGHLFVFFEREANFV